jgi:hypothetical protein
MRKKIGRHSCSFLGIALVLLSVPAIAQSRSESTDLVRAALSVAAQHYESIGIARTRPFLVDTVASADASRRAGLGNPDVSAVLRSLSLNARGTDLATAVTCTVTVGARTCQVVDDGVLLKVDSVAISDSSAEVFVRYRYTARRGPKNEWYYVPFVQLRVDFARQSLVWRVVGNKVTLRS